ncbi:MAG: class I SAM-dependent methyltransferase [Flavobacteriales bacterium]|nr:class I SAM-dependent methyltransferase [Flavobacteriales bacterium]
MTQQSAKDHWNTIYSTKAPDQVSWTQQKPIVSLETISKLNLDKNAKIIDVGGGDSSLVDYLLELGFNNISVLDISEKAIERAKIRLGNKANQINWIVCDITEFTPTTKYDFWHDRATFHFLTEEAQIKKYVSIVNAFVSRFLFIGTFSETGPKKCSNLDIKQYSQQTLCKVFESKFKENFSFYKDHTTPFETYQNFIFCCMERK